MKPMERPSLSAIRNSRQPGLRGSSRSQSNDPSSPVAAITCGLVSQKRSKAKSAAEAERSRISINSDTGCAPLSKGEIPEFLEIPDACGLLLIHVPNVLRHFPVVADFPPNDDVFSGDLLRAVALGFQTKTSDFPGIAFA